MKNITAKDFKREVLEKGRVVIVDFYADWCGPCKMISPILEQLAENHSERAHFRKFDIDSAGASEITDKYEIRAVPTIMFFKKGEVADKIIGVAPKDVFEQKILGL